MSQAFDDLAQEVDILSQSADNHEQRLQPLEEQFASGMRGQLDFPLDLQSQQEIKDLFPTGFATLVAGTVTVADNRILTSSTILIGRSTAGGTLGHLSIASQANGSFIINSSSATDTSVINYVAFN